MDTSLDDAGHLVDDLTVSMPAHLLSVSLTVVVTIAAATCLNASLEPQSTATPESMSPEEWSRLIHSNPDDQLLWSRELNLLRQFRRELVAISNPTTEVLRGIALANNDELQGIALRHLKRYDEALEALSRSEQHFLALSTQQGCDSVHPGSRCADIAEGRERVQWFIMLVHTNVGDSRRADAVRSDMVARSRTTTHYEDRLRRSVLELVQRDAFGTASALIVSELQHAIDTRHDNQLKVAARVGESMLELFFNGISWTAQNKLRDGDPRDFVDNTGIGIGRRAKYGMTDPDEDMATFFTAKVLEELVTLKVGGAEFLTSMTKKGGYGSIEELVQNARLTDYVRREMADGNFEPVAKNAYLEVDDTLYNLAGQVLVCRERASSIPFAEVSRRLRQAPAGTVAATTSEILAGFGRLVRFRDTHCRLKAR